VGRVGRAHGLRGEVVIEVRTDEPERRLAPGTTFAGPRGPLTITSTRWHGDRLLATFAETADRTQAESMRGIALRLDVPDDERPDDPEEFYDHQLVGLRARVEAGAEVGPVTDVLHLPSQDVLVLDVDGREVLVPFVAEFVPAIDLDEGVVLLRPQPGLLDLDGEGS
jgi:16S rRNA processing protein RimM